MTTAHARRRLDAAYRGFQGNPSAANYKHLLEVMADFQAEALANVEAARERQWQAAVDRIGAVNFAAN